MFEWEKKIGVVFFLMEMIYELSIYSMEHQKVSNKLSWQ